MSKAFRKWGQQGTAQGLLVGELVENFGAKVSLLAGEKKKRVRKNTLSPFSRSPFHATPHYLNVWNRLSAKEEPGSLPMGRGGRGTSL